MNADGTTAKASLEGARPPLAPSQLNRANQQVLLERLRGEREAREGPPLKGKGKGKKGKGKGMKGKRVTEPTVSRKGLFSSLLGHNASGFKNPKAMVLNAIEFAPTWPLVRF